MRKYFTLFCSLILSLNIWAAPAQSNEAFSREVFNWIKKISLHPEKFRKVDLKKYFSKDIHYTVNGKLLATNHQGLEQRFQQLLQKNKYTDLKIKKIQTVGNATLVDYNLGKLDHAANYSDVKLTVIFNINHHQISNWQAVSS